MSLLTKYSRKDYTDLIMAAPSMSRISDLISDFKVYLSDSELSAVINKFNVTSATDVLYILEQNAPLNNRVLQYLTDHIKSLTAREQFVLSRTYQSQVDHLYDNVVGLSPRGVKAAEIYQLGVEQKYIVEVLSEGCCRAQPIATLNEIQFAVDNSSINKAHFQKMLVDFAVEYSNTKLATQTLNSIDTDNNQELKDYVALEQFLIRTKQFGKTLVDLNRNDITTLKNIANDNTAAGIVARNAVLSIQDSSALDIQIPLIKPASLKKERKPINPLSNIRLLKEKPIVYPNPAKDLLYLNLVNVSDLPDHLQVKVYNSSGILIDQFKQKAEILNKVDISHITQGAYFVEVLDEYYQLINRSKVVFIK